MPAVGSRSRAKDGLEKNMSTTIYGTVYGDVIYQSDFGSCLDIYAADGNDAIYLDITGSYGGYNYVSAGWGHDFVKNYYEGGNVVKLGGGNDHYIGLGFSASSSYDSIYSGAGKDVFEIYTRQSDYYGEDGNDVFYSAGFSNYINGGNGNDTVSYAIQDSDPDLAGQGVYVSLSRGYAETYGTSYHEQLISVENATGTGAADDIYGSSSANVLKGNDGSDLVYGLRGNDRMYGGSGDDFLSGGAGADRLWGGNGADTFIFSKVSDSTPLSRDIIYDFSSGQGDNLDLSSIDANAWRSGNQAFTFINSSSFSEHAGELRYSRGMLSGDVDGDGQADFQIKLDGAPRLHSYDIHL
jgi:serralysin